MELTRRTLLGGGLAMGAGAALGAGRDGRARPATSAAKIRFSLNASTIRPAPLERKVAIAAEAGYDGIELWSGELDAYAKEGKSLKDLGKRIRDLGLCVPNVIGLFGCMPPEDEKRPKALETARIRMDHSAQVGAQCIAVIADFKQEDIDLLWAVERYREFLAMGREFGLKAGFEFVGFCKSIYTLAQAAFVALQANDREACLVADTFHLFRGGSGFNGIKHLNGDFIQVFHFNDVPADKPREQQRDGDRLYPGDGCLPLVQVIRDLKSIGYTGALSLEIFRKEYWSQDPLTVARTGLEKMKAVVAEA